MIAIETSSGYTGDSESVITTLQCLRAVTVGRVSDSKRVLGQESNVLGL